MATSRKSNGWSRDACLTDHRTWDANTHTDHTMDAGQPQAALDQGRTMETAHWYDDDRVLAQDRREIDPVHDQGQTSSAGYYLDCSEHVEEVTYPYEFHYALDGTDAVEPAQDDDEDVDE